MVDRCLEAGAPLPFSDLCLPFVLVARARLRDRSGSACEQLTHEAHAGLERHLLTRLSVLKFGACVNKKTSTEQQKCFALLEG